MSSFCSDIKAADFCIHCGQHISAHDRIMRFCPGPTSDAKTLARFDLCDARSKVPPLAGPVERPLDWDEQVLAQAVADGVMSEATKRKVESSIARARDVVASHRGLTEADKWPSRVRPIVPEQTLEQGVEEFYRKDEERRKNYGTGAYRSGEDGKYDYEGFISPEVLARYADYMHRHRRQKNGQWRDSDNWQKGIPVTGYMKSLTRHFIDLWRLHRNPELAIINPDDGEPFTREDLACAILFNVMGLLFEWIKQPTTNTKG